MRPKSIILFERLYLASIATGVVITILTYERTIAQIGREPSMAALGWGAGTFVIIFAISMAVSLLLYYLIAYRANVIAKWVLVAFTAIGFLGLRGAISAPDGLELAAVVLMNLLALGAVIMLFRGDARSWFAGNGAPDDGTTSAD